MRLIICCTRNYWKPVLEWPSCSNSRTYYRPFLTHVGRWFAGPVITLLRPFVMQDVVASDTAAAVAPSSSSKCIASVEMRAVCSDELGQYSVVTAPINIAVNSALCDTRRDRPRFTPKQSQISLLCSNRAVSNYKVRFSFLLFASSFYYSYILPFALV